jgi:hypothetical protein
MTNKPNFKLPLPPYPGTETPIEVPYKEPLEWFAGRDLRRMPLVDGWHWSLFKLSWPMCWHPEHLYLNGQAHQGGRP